MRWPLWCTERYRREDDGGVERGTVFDSICRRLLEPRFRRAYCLGAPRLIHLADLAWVQVMIYKCCIMIKIPNFCITVHVKERISTSMHWALSEQHQRSLT